MIKQELRSVFDLNWKPRTVIEASAGTGKTYTIVGIFIRLLIEQKLTIDQILVMTFTKKATAELRERIFDRLQECLQLLEHGYSGSDTFLIEFETQIDNKNDTIKLLRRAIQDFDDAQVTTIHGFCQKILSEESLLTRTPFKIDVIQDDTLLKEASEDFWRQFIDRYNHSDAGKYYISKLFNIAKSPKELRNKLSDLFSKPYAIVEGEEMDQPIDFLSTLLTLRKRMRELWQDDKATIINELLNSDMKRFSAKNVNSRAQKMEVFLQDDLFSQDDFAQLKYFTTDYFNDESNRTKNGDKLPKHTFFDISNEYINLVDQIKKVETGLINEVFRKIKSRRDTLSIRSESVTYDDLLLKVNEALSSSGSDGELAKKLRIKYPFVLVDEFQDTDPVQYSIFDVIYPVKNEGSSLYGLFMIGDPKQAIYGFRGADIYTYFKAVTETSGTIYTLKNNFRSSPKLIDAINQLFLKSENSFIQPEIEFFTSNTGMPDLADKYLIDGEPPVPFQVIAKKGITSNKKISEAFAIQQTVAQIFNLLEKSEAGEVMIGTEKLRASDIAVLVPGHKDAAQIKSSLKESGIDSVTYSRQNVFDTFEATRIEWLITALLDPFNTREANQALMSGFFGNNLYQLFEQKENENARRIYIQELQKLHDIWSNNGFLSMFRALLYTNQRLAEIAKIEDSERVLTNLYQLADITSKAEHEGDLNPYALHRWFLNEMSDPDKDDKKTLLLESDQNLVKISTIHNSKGLEFPVVFCPMLWKGRKQEKQFFEQYHREKTRELCINIDQEENEKSEYASNRRMLESVAEEVRKTYVALTRAKYFCSIIWDTHSTSHFSGLGSLLIGGQEVNKSIENNYNNIKNDNGPVNSNLFIRLFNELGESNPSLCQVHFKDDSSISVGGSVRKRRHMKKKHKASVFKGRHELIIKNRLSSFSSISGHKEEVGEPDYDQQIEAYADAFNRDDSGEQELTIFNFPRGATAGTAIHKLFEHEHFDFTKVKESNMETVIPDVLARYGYEPIWEPVLYQMLQNVIQAKIPGLSLDKVCLSDQLREMEFHFSSMLPEVDQLLAIIRNQPSDRSFNTTNSSFMTGFIDLIVRQNGVYYILDYKSNYLGDSIEDYQQDRLADEIIAAKYDLQYHIYIVALVKFLKKRMPNFSYEKHFGGAAYLFVRGMRAGSSEGVWFDKPPKQIIEQLEEVLEQRI